MLQILFINSVLFCPYLPNHGACLDAYLQTTKKEYVVVTHSHAGHSLKDKLTLPDWGNFTWLKSMEYVLMDLSLCGVSCLVNTWRLQGISLLRLQHALCFMDSTEQSGISLPFPFFYFFASSFALLLPSLLFIFFFSYQIYFLPWSLFIFFSLTIFTLNNTTYSCKIVSFSLCFSRICSEPCAIHISAGERFCSDTLRCASCYTWIQILKDLEVRLMNNQFVSLVNNSSIIAVTVGQMVTVKSWVMFLVLNNCATVIFKS